MTHLHLSPSSPGVPQSVSVEGEGKTVYDSLEIFDTCNRIGAKHGVGRVDLVENRHIGIKVRVLYVVVERLEDGGSLRKSEDGGKYAILYFSVVIVNKWYAHPDKIHQKFSQLRIYFGNIKH